MSINILPDSRARTAKGVVRGPDGKSYVKIFCANCGSPWGMVPEELITFAFALCNDCSEKHGDPAHFYKEPDAIFWERAAQAQLEERVFTAEELTKKLGDPASALSKLAAEWRQRVLRTQK